MALLEQGHSVLSFDILLDSSLDLLENGPYEALLRISASGKVGYGAHHVANTVDSNFDKMMDQKLSDLPNIYPACPTLQHGNFNEFKKVLQCYRAV